MFPDVSNYLDEVRSHLHLDFLREKQVISELSTYFQEKIAELQASGVSARGAAREAVRAFGRPKVVAQLIYEAHSKGSWGEALVSSLPHLLVASLFASHLWRHPILASLVFLAIVCATLFGWWHGKPCWLYSWIGYSLSPLLVLGFASKNTLEQAWSFLRWAEGSPPSIWLLLLILTLIVLSLWIIVKTTIRVVKRDWILTSLMLVPLPILGSWLFNIERVGGLFRDAGMVVYYWDTSMALILIVLALMSAVFIRLRPRALKIWALVTVGVTAGTMASYNLWGNLGFLGLMVATLPLLLFLLSPALLEARIGHGEPETKRWWVGDWLERHSPIK